MGDRATVLLYSQDERGYSYSPVIYTHWMGSNVEETVSKMQRMYMENDTNRDWNPQFRQEIERVFPILCAYMGKDGHNPSVYNFDTALDFVDKLPKANDMPIIADDWGLYLINVMTLDGVWSSYSWDEVS